MVKYLPAVGALLLALVFVGGALRPAPKLACDRTACTYNGRAFAFTEVREVRFVTGLGKNSTYAETQLVFANGRELALGRDPYAEARETYAYIHQFFSPVGPASLTWIAKGTSWMWLVVVGFSIAAGVLGLRAHRTRDTYRTPDQQAADWTKRKKYVLYGLGGAALVGGIQLAIMLVAGKLQGTLVLECKQRCRFQGIECLPGGSSRQTLDEGSYPIEIWATSGAALWIPKTVQITKGETTTFVCE